MRITTDQEAFIVMSDQNFTGRRLYASSETTIIRMSINPGGGIEAHSAELDMEFYVISGRGIFSVGEQSAEAVAGSLVESPAGIPHGIRNPGPESLELLAIKNGSAQES
jgi:Mannose-6-phosphate isomerase